MLVTLFEEYFRPVRPEKQQNVQNECNVIIVPPRIIYGDEEELEEYNRAYCQAGQKAKEAGQIFNGEEFARQYEEERRQTE